MQPPRNVKPLPRIFVATFLPPHQWHSDYNCTPVVCRSLNQSLFYDPKPIHLINCFLSRRRRQCPEFLLEVHLATLASLKWHNINERLLLHQSYLRDGRWTRRKQSAGSSPIRHKGWQGDATVIGKLAFNALRCSVFMTALADKTCVLII